jgi:hypothetical protein
VAGGEHDAADGSGDLRGNGRAVRRYRGIVKGTSGMGVGRTLAGEGMVA